MENFERHIKARACSCPPGGFIVEGLTDDQCKALSYRVNRSIDETRQWFSIWKQLFPSTREPDTHYLRNNLEELLFMIWNYWGLHSDEIIAEATRVAHKGGEDTTLTAISSRVVGMVLQKVFARSQVAMDPSSSDPATRIKTDFCFQSSGTCERNDSTQRHLERLSEMPSQHHPASSPIESNGSSWDVVNGIENGSFATFLGYKDALFATELADVVPDDGVSYTSTEVWPMPLVTGNMFLDGSMPQGFPDIFDHANMVAMQLDAEPDTRFSLTDNLDNYYLGQRQFGAPHL